MPKLQFSSKRLQIDRANATMIIFIAAAVFVLIFSIVAVKALWSQRGYQARVIKSKEEARDQLKKNIDTVGKLAQSYQQFVTAPENVLGGSSTGGGEKDGDNAKIVLDALPSKYDYPALTSSVEKILTDKGFKINSITGTDDEANQTNKDENQKPEKVEMPVSFSVTGSYRSIQDLVPVFELSIRPFLLKKITLSAQDKDKLDLKMDLSTYYQPKKNLQITTKEVK